MAAAHAADPAKLEVLYETLRLETVYAAAIRAAGGPSPEGLWRPFDANLSVVRTGTAGGRFA
jgi:hypothetical protein